MKPGSARQQEASGGCGLENHQLYSFARETLQPKSSIGIVRSRFQTWSTLSKCPCFCAFFRCASSFFASLASSFANFFSALTSFFILFFSFFSALALFLS